jgi:hypothetical protein
VNTPGFVLRTARAAVADAVVAPDGGADGGGDVAGARHLGERLLGGGRDLLQRVDDLLLAGGDAGEGAADVAEARAELVG